MELRIREVDIEAGARSKGSNGGVAVGLPHRNSSVFKQTHINQRKVKGRIRMELRIREVDEGGGRLTGTRASEAKGPFPGGKRVGSWGKKKNKRESKSKSNTKAKSLDHVIGGKYSESFWLNIKDLPCSDIKLFEFRKVNLNKYTRCRIQILKMNPNHRACRINMKYFSR